MKYATLGLLVLVILPSPSYAQFNPFNNTPFDPSTWPSVDPNVSGSSVTIFTHPPQSVSTFDDPIPPPPSGQYITYDVVNQTYDTVAFQLIGKTAGQWYTLRPQYAVRLNIFASFNQTPLVSISQLGGGVRRFTIQNNVPYAFRVNPSTNQIENYYR